MDIPVEPVCAAPVPSKATGSSARMRTTLAAFFLLAVRRHRPTPTKQTTNSPTYIVEKFICTKNNPGDVCPAGDPSENTKCGGALPSGSVGCGPGGKKCWVADCAQTGATPPPPGPATPAPSPSGGGGGGCSAANCGACSGGGACKGAGCTWGQGTCS